MKKICIILALLAIISACKVEKEEKTRMLSKYEEMKAHCVGRHVVDMPSSFLPSQVTNGIFKAIRLNAQDPSFEVIVRETGLTREKFASEVQKRRAELRNSSSDTVDVLRLEKALSDEATLFRVQLIDDAYVSEINFLRGSSIVTVSLDSYRGQFLAAEESLIKFAEAIKEKNEEISSAQPQGFCLGSVIITGEFKEENGSFLVRDGKGNAFGIEIDTYKADESVPLLKRVSGPDSLLTKFDVRHTVLRARERTVAGMRAQEWLGWTKLGEQEDEKTFGFALETMRPAADKTTPSIHVSFDTGQPLEDGSATKTVISDEEAIQLWDSVVKSIRPATR
jgi:hypothetical protein